MLKLSHQTYYSINCVNLILIYKLFSNQRALIINNVIDELDTNVMSQSISVVIKVKRKLHVVQILLSIISPPFSYYKSRDGFICSFIYFLNKISYYIYKEFKLSEHKSKN